MIMANMHASYYPRRANLRVPNLAFHSEVNMNGQCRIDLGAPVAASTNGIMNAVPSTAIITKGGTLVSTFDPDKHMGAYGRNIVITLGASGTVNTIVRGRDYLGQPISEQINIAAGTTAAGKKAFKSVDNITTSAASGTTISLGWGDVLGLPFSMLKLSEEYLNDAPATAGTFVAGVATQTITSGDPRGTYAPNSATDGARNWYLIGTALQSNLHGVAHYTN